MNDDVGPPSSQVGEVLSNSTGASFEADLGSDTQPLTLQEEEGELEEVEMKIKKKPRTLVYESSEGSAALRDEEDRVSWDENLQRSFISPRGKIIVTWPMIKGIITSRRFLYFLAILAGMSVFTAVIIIFYSDILNFFINLVNAIKDAGPIGYVFMAMAIWVTTWPPVIGYAYLLIGSGYVFGWYGFIPAYIGSVTGAMCCFLVFRYLLRDWVQRKAMAYPKFVIIEKAIASEGLPFVALIRVAPYPFPLFNLLFAASSVSFWTFSLGTMIAQFKILIHIYIGKSLQNVSGIVAGTTGVWTYVFIALAITITVILSVYVCLKSRHILAKYQADMDAEAEEAEAVSQSSSSSQQD